jgi:hypothetical protein
MRNAFICLASFVLLSSSCSKKEEVLSKETSAKETLMVSAWKRSEYKEDGTARTFWGSCELDDKLTFGADGNYKFSDEGVRCQSNMYTMTDFYVILDDNKTMRWGGFGEGELVFNSSKTSFTYKGKGASVSQEWTYVKY